MGLVRKTACGITSLTTLFCISTFAAPPSNRDPQVPQLEEELAEIPKKPTAPIPLPQKAPIDAFHCQRFFVYKEKVLGCDSNIRLDGEKLRPILGDNPAAIAELNEYQKSRMGIQNAAYVGTAGVFVMLAGWVISSRVANPSTSTAISKLTFFGGAGIIASSFIYALSSIRTNEQHLGNAVSLHNEAHPHSPIELRFSTGINF